MHPSHEQIMASAIFVRDHRSSQLAAVGDRLSQLIVNAFELELRRFAQRHGLRDQEVELFEIGPGWHRKSPGG